MSVGNDLASLSTTTNIFDVGGLTALKGKVRAGDPESKKAVANEFEALFLQLVLKSMRTATPGEGLFSSDQTRMYESLLDQQLGKALSSSSNSTGLAAMIEEQLARQNLPVERFAGPLPLKPVPREFTLKQNSTTAVEGPTKFPFAPPTSSIEPSAAVSPAPTFLPGVGAATQRAFVDRLLPAAESASRQTGIPAHFIVAQAALETGWGKSEPSRADGGTSFNIFGIKAGGNWHGPSVERATTEVVAGKAQLRVERFRSYGSYEEALQDYANLLTGSSRYAQVLGSKDAGSFAGGLQAAGYATDPQYAAKLERVIRSNFQRQAAA